MNTGTTRSDFNSDRDILGARRGEVCAIRWADVDLDRRVI